MSVFVITKYDFESNRTVTVKGCFHSLYNAKEAAEGIAFEFVAVNDGVEHMKSICGPEKQLRLKDMPEIINASSDVYPSNRFYVYHTDRAIVVARKDRTVNNGLLMNTVTKSMINVFSLEIVEIPHVDSLQPIDMSDVDLDSNDDLARKAALLSFNLKKLGWGNFADDEFPVPTTLME